MYIVQNNSSQGGLALAICIVFRRCHGLRLASNKCCLTGSTNTCLAIWVLRLSVLARDYLNGYNVDSTNTNHGKLAWSLFLIMGSSSVQHIRLNWDEYIQARLAGGLAISFRVLCCGVEFVRQQNKYTHIIQVCVLERLCMFERASDCKVLTAHPTSHCNPNICRLYNAT